MKTAAKTVLGKINLKKINPKKIRMKTDPGMKVADSLVLKKQIVLKAAKSTVKENSEAKKGT